MPITIYTNDDIRPGAIAGQRIAIIGYGSQGRAHAQNLKDSGHDVITNFDQGYGVDAIRLEGFAEHSGELSVSHTDSRDTVITYGQTTITVQGANLSEEDIRNMQK